MKKPILLLFFLQLFIIASAQKQNPKHNLADNEYMNPIFPGDYPDPSILVDGDDYYLTHSSFEYHPGLTIWHSTDLINWEPVTNALQNYIGSVWAPDLVKHNGKYYIYLPSNNTNYVIYADKIEGPWSEPIDLKIGNIDPGHIADANGNRYLYFSDGGYIELTKDGLATKGELKHAYDGWEIPKEWTIECFCMEGPKIMKHGEYYYLTVAEGGTAGPATGHMVISARSKSPIGPWENSPYNPIIRTESAEDQWWSVGHATIFNGTKDNLWMIFHGYEKDHQNMGRQTMLSPLEWTEDGWFKMPENVQIDQPIKLPYKKNTPSSFTLSDDFDGNTLNPQWHFFNSDDKERYSVKNNTLTIKGKGNNIANSAPVLLVPSDHSYTAEIELETTGTAIGGFTLFYNDRAFSGVLADKKDVYTNLRGWQFVTEKDVLKNKVHLKLENKENVVNMYYSTDGKNWNKVESSLEVSAYHHNVLGGFLSLRIGLVAMGDGEVKFKNFTYKPIN
ncbi:family 43 glycosylhydrolase [Joostella sp. CR20]|uniref:family 43 glycosylhydrolase n=1 Tax=Joostella sp. CR20 TaxID=2804312 RepID=UPI00313C195E